MKKELYLGSCSSRPLITPPKEGGCTGEPDPADSESVLDKVRISHKEQPDHHRLPSAHSFPIDEADETDAAKKEAGEQIGRREIRHASGNELDPDQSRPLSPGRVDRRAPR